MRRFFARARALQQRGVLGINRRNGGLVLPLNPRRLFPSVDDKLETKRRAESAGLPVPRTFGVIGYHHQLRELPRLLDGREEFVLKPARGAQGNGIVIIAGIEPGGYRKSSGVVLTAADVRQHVANTISGVFSLRGDLDRCLIEERLVLHPAFGTLARFGIPDVRIIVYRGMPIMGMCRLPTVESDGRANLHQGAIGIGLAIATGRSTHAVCWNETITHHIDTHVPLVGIQIPDWDQVLSLAVRAAAISGLGYQGVDIVIDAARGPLLLELNARPGLAIQIANNEGLLSRLQRADRLPAATVSAPWTERLQIARELF